MPYLDESVPDFPTEDARILVLVVLDFLLYIRCGDAWFTSADSARTDASGLLVPLQDFADAAV